MDKLQAMAVFLAVVDQGGFAAAARKLKISAPAATRAVGELEAAMGVRLLTRTTRVVRVTEAGMRYAGDCRRIPADLAEAEEAAAGTHGSVRGHLVVTAPAMFGRMHVTPIVTAYLRRYPETRVECRFVDRVVNMMEEGVDVAVRIGALQDSSYQALRVGQVRRVVCAAPAYLKRRGVPRLPADLARHVVISGTGVNSGTEWRFVGADATTLVRVEPRLTVTVNDEAIAAAIEGFGVARVLSYMVAQHLADGRLVEVLREHESLPLPVHVMQHEGLRAAQKVRAFLDMATRALRGNPVLR